MTLRHLPNALSVARILAVPPLVYLLLTGHYGWALAIALFAGVSDLLDGWLARRFGWQSRFGSMADPAADKLLLVSCYLALAMHGFLPWWLFALVILRDLVIVFGAWIYHVHFSRLEAQPTRLSKINTVVQIALLWYALIMLAQLPWLPMPAQLQPVLILLVASFGLASLIQYSWLWSRKAMAISRARKASPP